MMTTSIKQNFVRVAIFLLIGIFFRPGYFLCVQAWRRKMRQRDGNAWAENAVDIFSYLEQSQNS
jgi:hypothetical protein